VDLALICGLLFWDWFKLDPYFKSAVRKKKKSFQKPNIVEGHKMRGKCH
jgi:hypothetical protein